MKFPELILFVLTVVTWFDGIRTAQVLSLNGVWSVSNGKNVTNITGHVPGGVYTALMNNRIIGDPYYRYNDREYKWVGEMDWSYSRTFNVSSSLLAASSVVLVCDGLDTVSTVKINGQTVGNSDNMFIRYVYDIKSALKMGTNTLTVEFQSAPSYAKTKASQRSHPILPACVPPEYHGECGANQMRKMQCSFSWDWGPSYPSQGIWKDIYIQSYSSAVLREVTSETANNKNGTWTLIVEAFTEVTPNADVQGTIAVALSNTSIKASKPVSLNMMMSKVRFELLVPSNTIKMWWPNGHGNQTLYDLQVTFTDSQGQMDSKKIRIGFRTVELVQDCASANKSIGRLFYFRINGRPIFFKGTNWIPADSFLERITKERLYNYLKSAADVHMNAMRVWGGGIYESREFYEICDELGIMIWQDFMFACAMYPTDMDFLSSVTQEVKHQVRRIKHHPSIVVLSGNNENEKALVQNWYGTNTNFSLYKSDYLKLYIDTVYAILKQEDTSRPFIASSPSNGIESELEGWVAKNPADTLYGDIHEYKYLVPFFDPSQYRIPRFSSEYGLQSWPSYEGLEPVFNESDMDYYGDLCQYRNHHGFGNQEMIEEAKMYVNLPNTTDKKQEFKDLIYITQIDQSIGMRTETEHLRRWQNQLDKDGQGNTMGALYWMLADIWQAPTWASLEYGGKWKMLHYYAQHFFAPTLISPYMNGNDLDVYLVVDELPVKEVRHPTTYQLHFKPKSNPRPFNVFDLSTYGNQPGQVMRTNQILPQNTKYDGNQRYQALRTNQILQQKTTTTTKSEFVGTLFIELYQWSGLNPLKTWKVPFEINSTAQSIFRHNVDDMIKQAGGVGRNRCFVTFHLGDKVKGPTSWYSLTTFKDAVGLQKANIQIKQVSATQKSDEFTIMLETNNVAPFVWLEAYGVKGRFSDNGFLLSSASKTLTFYAWESLDIQRLKSSLTVKSLMDVY